MSLRTPIFLLLVLALVACGDDDENGGSTTAPTASSRERVLALRNFESSPPRTPGARPSLDVIHATGVVSIEVFANVTGRGRTLETICGNKADETEAGFYFGIEARDDIANARLRLNVTDENGNTVVDAQGTPGSVGFGGWQHLYVVSDGTTVRFGVDGVEQVLTPTFANLGSSAPAARPFMVGGLFDGTRANFTFRNDVDDLRIWADARTPAELTAFVDAPLPSSEFDDDLLGYWSFDGFERLTDPNDGVDDLRDASPFGNHLDAPTQLRLAAGSAFDVVE